MYHYTYRLTDNEGFAYIGARSCNHHPEDDVAYMSSSKYVATAIKQGVVFSKQILAIWPTRELAIQHEIRLHDAFDVAKNPLFYNKSKQTNTKFDTTGFVFSEESRKKISVSAKRKRGSRVCGPNSLKGKKQSLQHVANRAKSQIGKTGLKNNRGAKPIWAINLTTKVAFLLVGKQNIMQSGFDPSTVHRICRKKPSSFTHKKHTFRFLCNEELSMYALDLE